MSSPETGFASVNGAGLYYELVGQGQPLVLVHGFGLDLHLWDEQFRDYSRRFRVLRYDLRGFGRSDPPGGAPYTHTGDLRTLLDHCEFERASLVGLSLGGAVALSFAQQFPHRVNALILVGTALNGRPMTPEWEAEVAPIWREARALGAEATKRRWQQIRLFAGARAHPAAAARLAQMLAAWSGWHFVNRDPGAIPDPEAARLAEVRAPTLVVIGEHDLPEFHAMSDELMAISLARKAVVPGVGHLPPLEAPALFDALVLGFLDELEP